MSKFAADIYVVVNVLSFRSSQEDVLILLRIEYVILEREIDFNRVRLPSAVVSCCQALSSFPDGKSQSCRAL